MAAAVALTACEVNLNSEGIVSRETKTFKVSGVPDVQLETFDGSIEVHSWDRNEVEVEIEKRAMEQSMVDEMVISSEQQGDRIIVKVTQPRNRDFDGIQIGVNFSPTARLHFLPWRGTGNTRSEAPRPGLDACWRSSRALRKKSFKLLGDITTAITTSPQSNDWRAISAIH